MVTDTFDSGLLPQQDAYRHGQHHAGRQDGGAALRDARRQAQVDRAHAQREGGRVIKNSLLGDDHDDGNESIGNESRC